MGDAVIVLFLGLIWNELRQTRRVLFGHTTDRKLHRNCVSGKACLIALLFFSCSFFSDAAWRIKKTAAAGNEGEVQFNDGGELGSVGNFFESAMDALLMAQTNEFNEMFDSGWSDAGGGLWTNETGWTASNAFLGTVGQVSFSSPGAWLQSPMTSNGFASVEMDIDSFNSASYGLYTSTDGETWAAGGVGGNNVFLRIVYSGGLPSFGGSPYIELNSLSINGFENPERYGLTNSFAGRDVRVSYAVDDANPVPLLQFKNGIFAAHGSRWAEWEASQEIDAGPERILFDGDYSIETGTNDFLSINWNRNPIIQVFGGATEFVNPYMTGAALTSTTVTYSVLGSSGWRPYPEVRSNLMSGAWVRLSIDDFSSSYPVLADGQYTLSFEMPTGWGSCYWRSISSNETATAGTGTNLVVIRYDMQLDGNLIFDGVPTETNNLAAFSVWCDTNDSNTLKVVLP